MGGRVGRLLRRDRVFIFPKHEEEAFLQRPGFPGSVPLISPSQAMLSKRQRAPGARGLAITSVAVILVALAQASLIAIPHWRCSGPRLYSYIEDTNQGPVEIPVTIHGSQYGVLFVRLNGGRRFTPWMTLQEDICGIAEQDGAVLKKKNSNVGTCDANCLEHMSRRCAEYSKIQVFGIITTVMLLFSSLIAIAGALCGLFRKSAKAPVICWVIAAIFSISDVLLFIGTSGKPFISLQETSQIPFPGVCAATFANLASASILTLSVAIAVFLPGVARHWALRSAAKRDTASAQAPTYESLLASRAWEYRDQTSPSHLPATKTPPELPTPMSLGRPPPPVLRRPSEPVWVTSLPPRPPPASKTPPAGRYPHSPVSFGHGPPRY